MSVFKKFIILKNHIGFMLTGLFFAIVGALILFKGDEEDLMLPLVILIVGVICFLAALYMTIKELKTPAEEHQQYDRVDPEKAPPEAFNSEICSDGPEEDFLFHYTGKANQSYVMKDSNGTPVYEANTDKIMQIKARPFVFRNCLTGEEETKMVSGTITKSAGVNDSGLSMTISSTFTIDGTDVWDLIASQGYGFSFSLRGLTSHYDVRRWNQAVGYAETGGTGLINPKYKDKPAGKIPAKGIYQVRCKREDIPGMFLICYAITQTEFTME